MSQNTTDSPYTGGILPKRYFLNIFLTPSLKVHNSMRYFISR